MYGNAGSMNLLIALTFWLTVSSLASRWKMILPGCSQSSSSSHEPPYVSNHDRPMVWPASRYGVDIAPPIPSGNPTSETAGDAFQRSGSTFASIEPAALNVLQVSWFHFMRSGNLCLRPTPRYWF